MNNYYYIKSINFIYICHIYYLSYILENVNLSSFWEAIDTSYRKLLGTNISLAKIVSTLSIM